MASKTDAAVRRPGTVQRLAALTEHVEQIAARLEAVEQTLAGDRDPSAADDSGNDNERYFPSLEQFVDLWLLPTFRRPLAALGMGSWRWCTRWWDHPEAWLVFGALWDEWELHRLEPLGMIEFTRDVLQMLPEVCGEHGPFTRCRVAATDDGYQGQRHLHVPAATAAPAQAGWWDNWWDDDPGQSDEQAQPLLFDTVEDFVVNLFLPTFRRDPNAVGVTRWNWCDQWWHHDEAVHHLMNLWYLFEARTPEGRLIEIRARGLLPAAPPLRRLRPDARMPPQRSTRRTQTHRPDHRPRAAPPHPWQQHRARPRMGRRTDHRASPPPRP